MSAAAAAPRSPFKRLAQGMGGQVFSRAALFLNTLGVVPMFLAAWGLTVYGEWIALTAVATLTSLSNFGLASAASTEIVKATAANDPTRAQRVFSTALCTLSLIFLPVLLVVFALASILPIGAILNVTHVSKLEIIAITMAMTVQVWFNTVKGLFFGVTFSAGKYAAPNIASGLARIFELACLAVVVGLLRRSPVYAASTIAAVALIDLVVQSILARRTAPWLDLRRVAIDRSSLQMLIGPSIGTALLHLGVNFVGVQGPRIVLSAVAGPAAVGIFSVYATANRVIDQVSSLVMSVFQLEFSRTTGAGDTDTTVRLLAGGGQITVTCYLMLAAGLLVGGPIVFDVWTHGKVVFHYPLACAFLVATLFTQSAKTPLTYLMGANHLLRPVVGMLGAGVVGLAIGAALARLWGPFGMASGQIASEALSLIIVAIFTARSIGTNAGSLIIGQFNIVGGARRLAPSLRAILLRISARRWGGQP